ncbi:MAG: 5-methyltetrahydropteroyltriglutamate--homocysteine methyltransferase [Planctomycetia bacterium]|nr:5-methyltetrahydropteroyltriglutamate--homocysteine methyltransferase [Planctomycetia bacterium]
MSPADDLRPAASFDGGDLDCGNGLLLLIRKHIDPLSAGQLLEIFSRESSVAEDLPSWCRLTGNELVTHEQSNRVHRFLVSRGPFAKHDEASVTSVTRPEVRDAPATATPRNASVPPTVAPIPPLAVLGIGSWPRPAWMLRALHERLCGRLEETEFQQTADDAIRLAVAAQERAGVDLITDGEQRRDNYASFVGALLENCQLVPITDLLAYVDDPEHFAEELRGLDVPADKVRHPAVFGRLARKRSLALHELQFVQSISRTPVKVALPGPYLLTRTMWLECVSDRAYASREELAADIVKILRAEAEALLQAGATLVQFDEPVLTEVVHGRTAGNRVFMCGALGARRDTEEELAFAEQLLSETLSELPAERLALHICRGNWTTDEGAALTGDYAPLMGLLARVPVGAVLLEMCTPRAGDVALLASLPQRLRIGVGVVNQKSPRIETLPEVLSRAERAIELFGADRVLLHPDCGFATFADSPIAAADVAERKLAVVVQAARQLRESLR